MEKKVKVPDDLGKLSLLAEKYPNIKEASTELINLQAISNLPKGTEHFISDLHGEYETFQHIMNNASGAIKDKVDLIYGNIIGEKERASLATLIYYPEEKLKAMREENLNTDEWYKITLNRLIAVCKLASSKYTRSKVRKALPDDFAYILEELLHNSYSDPNKSYYYTNIVSTIIKIGITDSFIIALCNTIKRLVVDHLHVLGDIFDRGSRPDLIMDALMKHHSLDIQWGNHDAIWMAAAAGSETCIAVALNNSISYNNLEFLEEGYGINLRPLALFASEFYKDVDVSCFTPKGDKSNCENHTDKDFLLTARMYKAIAVMKLKLEGQTIKKNPNFNMNDRLLLDKIDYKNKTVNIDGKVYPMKDVEFPTIDKNNPYVLSSEEKKLMRQLKSAFLHSEKLQKHIKFLYENGSSYRCFNGNLLTHGCIPLNDDGSLMEFKTNDGKLSGKALFDYIDKVSREAYFKENSEDKTYEEDFLWFLWCGKDSPLFGKNKMTTFERLFIEDKVTHEEAKNPYYTLSKRERVCINLLKEFGLSKGYCHIINGHVPVKSKDGEKPVRANGRLIMIDGGFCKAYQKTTGIAGYTLIYNSFGMKLCSHEPFDGTLNAINNNKDIYSTSVVSDKAHSRISVGETDIGIEMLKMIKNLEELILAYKNGLIKENKG